MVNDGPIEEVNPEHANLVSSHSFSSGGTEYHYPLIDLDIDAKLIPSSTLGHHHLLINKLMTKENYDKLLRVLHEVGIIQTGIIELQWEKEGFTAIRLPGEKKEFNSTSSSGKANGGMIIGGPTPASVIPEVQTTASNMPKLESVPIDCTTLNSKEYIASSKLPSDIQTGIEMFKELARVATETAQSLSEVVEAWKRFCGADAETTKDTDKAW